MDVGTYCPCGRNIVFKEKMVEYVSIHYVQQSTLSRSKTGKHIKRTYLTK